MSSVEEAVKIAVKAHAGQVDKGGQSYILHPLRVMLSLDTPKEMIVGVLHDTLEDTAVTPEDLYATGFDEEIVEAVLSVTRREGETYAAFILRAKQNKIGRRVKIADIKDNMRLDRIPHPTERDMSRNKRYQKALDVLLTD